MQANHNPDLPNHVGIIMDGNRRWARARGLKTMEGHFKGYRNLHELALYALVEKKVPFISAFVFSTENWSRTADEVGYLMKLVTTALKEYLEEFHRSNIRILVLGTRERLDTAVIKAIEKSEERTKNNTGGTLALCFNYGGQKEIIDAARNLVKQGKSADGINDEAFAGALYHPEVPPLDMVVRTSGEQRLSGFMLYRAAYAELLFMEKHWPDFTKEDIDSVLDEYAKRQRRYGK